MSVYDPRVDAYIERAASFARPVLQHLRALIHAQCPDITETMKWSFPHFDYKGRSLFNMAAFKEHCAFGFWLASVMSDPKGILQTNEKSAMGSLGRITALKDLPSDKVLAQYMKQSVQLADEGVKPVRAARQPVQEQAVPDDLLAALAKNRKAQEVFGRFAPSHRKEYLEWILEAKREETRAKRIAQAVEWMAEGKSRNWKYER